MALIEHLFQIKETTVNLQQHNGKEKIEQQDFSGRKHDTFATSPTTSTVSFTRMQQDLFPTYKVPDELLAQLVVGQLPLRFPADRMRIRTEKPKSKTTVKKDILDKHKTKQNSLSLIDIFQTGEAMKQEGNTYLYASKS